MKYRYFLALLVLSSPAQAEGAPPRDGVWTVRSVEAVMGAACPPYFQPMAEQMAANLGKRDTYDLRWNGRFDPNTTQGLDPDAQGVVWVAQDDGSWTANLAGEGKDYVVARMTQLSETEIMNRVEMDVERMMEVEGGALPGVAGCGLTMTLVMEHKG